MTKVFVVHCASHTDCYKRASSYSTIVGVFKNLEDAIHAAINEFDDLIERLGDFETDDEILKRFVDKKNLLTKGEQYIFELLSNIQLEQKEEFTPQANGKYIDIEELKIQ